ncbi:hypothetical protein [Brevundimonas aurantiaca]|jgi:hypothetical protein|uniref:hypothetical protein n=1 Tax=Brevundimonas aurantiaca TaxID=74316 RepID=UPI001749ABB6|nr:hypothetical protein [Brevundimonas aurantiaca]
MNRDEYINRKIETLGSVIGGGLRCWSAPEGLPNSVLQIEPVLFPQTPKIPLRIRADIYDDNGVDRLETFLKQEFGLTKGVDYIQHNNRNRGGNDYYDFTDPTLIGRLETYAQDRGLKPKEYLKLENPPWMKKWGGPSY